MITNFLYLFTFYLLSQLVKIKTWELRPILELSPILELKPPSDVEIFIKARALITVNTVLKMSQKRHTQNVSENVLLKMSHKMSQYIPFLDRSEP